MVPIFQTSAEGDVQRRREEAASEARGATLASLFAAACERHGERVAVCEGTEQITYTELNAAAGRVAKALLALELRPDALVAIHMERSIEMVAAMLGVIQAGAAYLPLDPNYPEARVRETVEDARPVALITERVKVAAANGFVARVLAIEDLLATSLDSECAVHPMPDDLAYVIYTSGSTGQPKGVMVTHHNVVRLLEQTESWFHFNEHDVWTMFHSFAFDFSVWEMWGCLLTGGRLVLVPFTVSRSPEEFYALLADEGVTVLNQTPTAFSLLVQAEGRVTPRALALRVVIFGGEALNLRALLPWFARHGDQTPQLINMYGITETTVHVTYRRIREADARTEVDSLIGVPIPDLQIHLLNDALLPVADGEVGEIFVGGPGVASGYLNRADLTSQRFLADPLSADGGRLYRSGDLARRRADGELVYLGRADRQVKVNGFRIELGEVESVLASFGGMAQVCVVAHTVPGTGQQLAAYFVADSAEVDSVSLVRFAEQRLPAQMRPAFYTRMDALPINGNGKIDRDALPEPQRVSITNGNAAGAVSTNSREATIAKAWQKVLHLEAVGLDDNFFDVGGGSMLLIALREELQTSLQVSIPVTWLFEHTTIRSLAVQLERATQTQATTAPASTNRAQKQRDSFARMRAMRGGSQ